MSAHGWCMLAFAALFASGREQARATDQQTSDLATLSGMEYRLARDAFLASRDRREVARSVGTLRDTTRDPVKQLWLESLLDHSVRPGYAEGVWHRAREEAALPQPTMVGNRVLPPVQQAQLAARRIVVELGESAAAYVSEALHKGLVEQGAQTESLIMILVLREFGRQRDPRTPTGDPHYFHPRDARAGWVLLGYLENLDKAADPQLFHQATLALLRFAEPDLVQAAAGIRDHMDDSVSKERWTVLVARMQAGLADVGRSSTRPADWPLSEKRRLGPASGWRERLR